MNALRRTLSCVALAGGLVLLSAGPAAADPARPTNYRSRVVSVQPATPSIEVRVVGGDGFLHLKVDRGHTVLVPSYGTNQPPYLRFLPNGVVEQNLLSPATYLNNSRFGGAAVPADALAATAKTAPQWRQVATDGQYSWHDHRIHWMGRSTPPGIDKATGRVPMGGPNGTWVVPLVVDGHNVTVSGDLYLHGAPSPLPWILLAVAAAALVAVLGRSRPVSVGIGAALAASLIALVVGTQQNAAIPPGAGATPLTVVLPVLALVAAVTAAILRPPAVRVISTLASVAITLGWSLLRATVLWKAILPTKLAFDLDRAGTALTLGLSVGAAILVVASGALKAAPLPDDEGEPAPPGPLASATP